MSKQIKVVFSIPEREAFYINPLRGLRNTGWRGVDRQKFEGALRSDRNLGTFRAAQPTHFKVDGAGNAEFGKEESEVEYRNRLRNEAQIIFRDATNAAKNYLQNKGKAYQEYTPEEKREFDRLVTIAYREKWLPLVTTMNDFNAAKKAGTNFLGNTFQEKQVMSFDEQRGLMEITVAMYYPFRGLQEPPPSGFEKAVTKVGMAFGVAVAGLLTAGAGAAVIGGSAPVISAGAIGTGTLGTTIGINPEKLQGALAGTIDLKDTAIGKLQDARDKVQSEIAKGPANLLDSAIKSAVKPSDSSLKPMPVANETPSNLSVSQPSNETKNAGIGSLVFGLLIVSAILSLKRG